MSDTSQIISPKQAAENATKFYREVTGTYPQMTLEEIEFKDGYWHVTLGVQSGLLYDQKDYKLFKVHATTGNVESMLKRK